MFFQFIGELGNDAHGQIVCPIVIVAVFGEIAHGFKIHGHALFVADGAHLGVFDGGKRIRRDGQTGDAKGR